MRVENDHAGAHAAGQELDVFISRYYADILRYCRWHTRDLASAEDAVQETFLKFVRFTDRYDDRGKTKAFLYRIAQNTCTDLMRKRQTIALTEENAYEEQGYLRSEMNADVQALLRHLSANQRELILLRYAQDLSLREIAGITNQPMRTVQTRIRKALTIMKTAGKGNEPYVEHRT